MSNSKKIIIAAGGIVLNPSKEILFIFRRGKWDLPKGKLDEGESIEQCSVREVEEETGLREITLNNFIGITKHEYFDEWIKKEVIKETHWYEMEIINDQNFVPQTEEDILEIKWVATTDMNTYLSNSYKNIMEIIEKWSSSK